MSSLDGNSTYEQVKQAYDENASYIEDNSTTKARAFITACKILLRRTPSNMQKGSNALGYNVQALKQELDDAVAWLEARDPAYRPGPSVTRADFRNFRGS
jgi:hypothetical protein